MVQRRSSILWGLGLRIWDLGFSGLINIRAWVSIPYMTYGRTLGWGGYRRFKGLGFRV